MIHPIHTPSTTPIDTWAIVGVNSVDGLHSLMRDRAEGYLAGYRTDLAQDHDMLAKARRGEILWVLRPNGTDLFCRSLLTDRKKLHYAALWLSAVAQVDSQARFFAGKMGESSGLIRRISREDAIERMGRWREAGAAPHADLVSSPTLLKGFTPPGAKLPLAGGLAPFLCQGARL